MAIAAVPKYLGTNFVTAAPGHRFGMYLKLWGENHETKVLTWETRDLKQEIRNNQPRMVPYENKDPALNDALKLNPAEKEGMQALATRQKTLAGFLEATGQLLRMEAKAVAPFATGLGNEHPLENGFAFLNPYGLPYLPGSGVKGVLRAAARELANGTFGGTDGWTFKAIEALFGREGEDGDTEHQRGALSFWDVIPQIEGDSLKVEVMTPHQSHYYQKGESPHESGSPNPINFLTVPPGSGFTFHVQCNRPFLARIAPGLAENDRLKQLLEAAFEHAFDWLGFGAKTAVGYGAMRQLTPEEMASMQADQLRCQWVNNTISEIAKKNKVPDNKLDDVLRGKPLAEAWQALTDQDLKSRALADIKARWQVKGWWDNPPPGTAEKARAIYG